MPVGDFHALPLSWLVARAPSAQTATTRCGTKGNGTPAYSLRDVDRDGLLDMVIRVSTETLALDEGDTEAVLEGETIDGVLIRGTDSVQIVP